MASDTFPDFELVPADGDDLTPDAELAALADAAGIADAETSDDDDLLPLGKSWTINGESTQFTFGVDSVVVWATIIVNMQRYAQPIMDDALGLEDPVRLIGVMDDPELRALSELDITEALTVHDRITNVGDFVWSADPDTEVVEMSATLEIDGNDEVRLEGIPVGVTT